MEDRLLKSYMSHENSFKKSINKNELENAFLKHTKKGTVGWWKYNYVMRNIDSILFLDKSNTFLTIGDGRFGSDSNYITSKGLNVLPTDISDYLLEYSLRKKFIKSYKKENAEKLTFKDDSFDFVFCKESYHHFPRPFIALYEMLRVSRKGVILIEPVDPFTDDTIIQKIFLFCFSFVFKLLGKKFTSESFEEDGNYIYRLSKREIKKVALGLGYPYVAFKGVNDYNCKDKWVDFNEPANKNSRTYRKTRRMIFLLDVLTGLGLFPKNLLIAVIFKENLNKKEISKLHKSGFEVVALPKNPYP